MNPSINRWLISGVWLAAVMALVSASTQGAIGVAAMWAMPAALAATTVGMGWPDKPMSRIVCGIGLVWQLALVGAYWPFAQRDAGPSVMGPMTWPMHSIVILGVLVLLSVAFVAMFLLPALGLAKRFRVARAAVSGPSDECFDRVAAGLQQDPELMPLWREYSVQLRTQTDAAGSEHIESPASARMLFDLNTVTHSRLRLDLFRNLPGVFTGIGIIGTFSGLIMGLRTFRIAQDPQVVQKSLELLMAGVWEAFLVSALAITLAIIVTLIEKVVMAQVARNLDGFVLALDEAHPPSPALGAADSGDWLPRLAQALDALAFNRGSVSALAPLVPLPEQNADGAQLPAQAHALAPAMPGASAGAFEDASASGSAPILQPAGAGAPASAELLNQLMELSRQSHAASTAVTDLAGGLPSLLAQQFQGANQAQQQSVQAMRALSSRLEGVASGIEVSGRKTLEAVAGRLLQSEANMNNRHQAVVQALVELVGRIEGLCNELEHSRASSGGGVLFDGAADPAFDFSGQRHLGNARTGAGPRAGRSARTPAVEYENFNGFDEAGYGNGHGNEDATRYDRSADPGSFGD